jgi:hypothetical protein
MPRPAVEAAVGDKIARLHGAVLSAAGLSPCYCQWLARRLRSPEPVHLSRDLRARLTCAPSACRAGSIIAMPLPMQPFGR